MTNTIFRHAPVQREPEQAENIRSPKPSKLCTIPLRQTSDTLPLPHSHRPSPGPISRHKSIPGLSGGG